MKRSLVVLSLVSLVFVGVGAAAVQKGDTELDFAGSLQFINYAGDTDNETLFTVLGRLGYFVTDNIQVGVVASGTWTEGDDLYGIGALGKYHFMPTNQLVPYIGGQAQYVFGDGDGLMWGPLAGVRYELNPTNDFFVEYQFQLFTGDLDDEYDSIHGVFFGIVHQFK